MFSKVFRKIKNILGLGRKIGEKYKDINPEDIFLDSTNLPGFEGYALEGRIEKPISWETFMFLKITLAFIILFLISKLWFLSILSGSVYAKISENNRLEQTLIFANRGVILDRFGLELATNDIKDDTDFAGRRYSVLRGLSHVVGYIKYPLVDSAGVYYETDYRAKDGAELAFDKFLKGKNGLKLKETNVSGIVTSESIVEEPTDGENVTLSIDAKLTETLYKAIEDLANSSRFIGGAGVIVDVETGEILALTSFPEYDQNLLTRGINQKSFNTLLDDSRKPFLNRAIGGLYTPGSIIKPIVALAALNEEIITPSKEILSTGSIIVPNPYDPEKPTIFKDWKEHGWTNMREALAVSSDTYFYSIGGGYNNQKGLGITLLDKYFQLFRISEITGIELAGELSGIIPTPQWKSERFDGDIWRLGDTYITSIGQYGTQLSPLNAARFVAAVANRGKLLKPSLLLGGDTKQVIDTISFSEEDWRVIHEGMREGVEYGTSAGLNVPYIKVAAKTGTAEIGSGKTYVHSWSIGFFPFESPKYAWAVVMEKGPATNTIGATSVVRQVLDWIYWNREELMIR